MLTFSKIEETNKMSFLLKVFNDNFILSVNVKVCKAMDSYPLILNV